MRTVARLTIGFLFTVLFICLFLASVNSIHVPVQSKAVSLPLGEQNRVENQWPIKKTDPYVEVQQMSISSLPKTAWCENDYTNSDRGIVLRCAWPVSEEVIKFQTAYVTVRLPSTDVLVWRFERERLMAVPQTENWFIANFWYMVTGAVCLLLALCTIFLAISPMGMREMIDEGQSGPR